jgi:hypothetical protein
MLHQNRDLALFKSKNALKFILSKSLRARKIADLVKSGPYANPCFRAFETIINYQLVNERLNK